MIDKNYCMSSYLAFRYIEKDNVDFYPNMYHKTAVLPSADRVKIVEDSAMLDVCLIILLAIWRLKQMN